MGPYAFDAKSAPSQRCASRRRRISAGSGTSVQEVNQLLKQFKQAKQMMQMMSKGRVPAAMKGMLGL